MYLGATLGPAVTTESWNSPLLKFRERALDIASAKAAPSVSVARYCSHALPCLSYVAQFTPVPASFRRLELATVTKLLHLPPSSLSCAAAFSLDSLGGPRVPRFLAMAEAILLRTAFKTMSGWKEHLCTIEKYRNDFGTFHGIYKTRALSPPHWKPPAIAEILRDAVARNPEFFKIAPELSLVSAFQQKAYKHVLLKLFPPNATALVFRRLTTHFPQHASRIGYISFERIQKILKQSQGHLSTSVLKSWLGSWTTSRRMHEPFLQKCLLGCPSDDDDWPHYAVCPRLWHLISEYMHKRIKESKHVLCSCSNCPCLKPVFLMACSDLMVSGGPPSILTRPYRLLPTAQARGPFPLTLTKSCSFPALACRPLAKLTFPLSC